MSELESQPSAAPVRKVWASFISTIVFAIVMGLISHYFPGIVFFLDTEAINFAISTLIFAIPGLFSTLMAYLAKEWKSNVPATNNMDKPENLSE